MNKPKGYITALVDRNHKTVADILRDVGKYKPRLRPVGRLDMDTTGLLLFTSDGEFNQRLTHPEYHVPKRYSVRLEQKVTSQMIDSIIEGIELLDRRVGRHKLVRASEVEELDEFSLCLTIHEGMNRQIRRMFSSVGNDVLGLKRLSIGPLTLPEGMNPGDVRHLSENEIDSLYTAVDLARPHSQISAHKQQ